ncbi:hypothetical protein WAI453_003794 [Rhynchosporium graminicola]
MHATALSPAPPVPLQAKERSREACKAGPSLLRPPRPRVTSPILLIAIVCWCGGEERVRANFSERVFCSRSIDRPMMS